MPNELPIQCCFDWGAESVARAVRRGDAIVIVDTLSFSTAVSTAVGGGAEVYPIRHGGDACTLADRVGGEVAVRRREVPDKGRFSLSPLTYRQVVAGDRIVLPSLNGGRCCEYAAGADLVIAAALVNAEAVGAYVESYLLESTRKVTVIACGEMRTENDGSQLLRFAIEDLLGAGAVISHLSIAKSPEAQVAEAAFVSLRERIDNILFDSESGVELREMGFTDDVRFAAGVDTLHVVPRLVEGRFVSCA
ncbi:MAG: 2-phosphosulfolactate phosphatase [candidate division Zixibacteria bacterium]|nr:2-phosphosulfolactate phosphatase [candidate division Zixibacteria bacterium]